MQEITDTNQPSEGHDAGNPYAEAWGRFRSDWMALAGLAAIALLIALAICAPLLANNKPLLVWTDTGIGSPALSAALAPESPEMLVEKSFNFLLLFMPSLAILLLALRKTSSKVKVTASLMLAFLLALPFAASGRRLDKTDWRGIAEKSPKGDVFIFAPAPYGPFETMAEPYMKPCARHILGTDQSGRDVFARMLYGARVSLAVGFAATAISMALGSLSGLLAGYRGGRMDILFMRLVEIVMCFPTFLLLLILMAIMLDYGFRQSILLVIAVIGLTGWTGLCRLVRGETLKQRAMPYIQAVEALGLPLWRILLLHLLPNVSGPIFVSFTFEVAGAILSESGLSFLGFGVQPPTASWGELLRQAFAGPVHYWHLTLCPGLAIFIAVCGFNFVGEGLRKALDPKAA